MKRYTHTRNSVANANVKEKGMDPWDANQRTPTTMRPWGRTWFNEALTKQLVNLAFKFLGFKDRKAIWGVMLNTVVRFEPDGGKTSRYSQRRVATLGCKDDRRLSNSSAAATSEAGVEGVGMGIGTDGPSGEWWIELDQLSVLMHGVTNKEIRDVDNVEFCIRLTKDVVELSRCQDGDIDRRGGCKVRFAQRWNTILLPILGVEDEVVVDPIGTRMGELMGLGSAENKVV
ncbi:hypothetical protein CBR_g28845 [Chara braunii]|uniref:Uncharacterized protein n=1 Tax=Chara braunii TaxID=69332 RepID=A0A388L9Z2_CHABU|nr:hypothetical protein CBR_g28845 [Chara braunii]|eukprot:GBG79130.1 hypothetical protein CBR_g28845 [Chara braunii]